MRRIDLPKVGLKRLIEDEDGKREVRDVKPIEILIEGAYDAGERGVLTIAEQRKRLPLWNALEAVMGDTVYLEDAEWEMLKGLMESHGFGWVHRDVLVIHDAIINAETVKIEEVPGMNRAQRRKAK